MKLNNQLFKFLLFYIFLYLCVSSSIAQTNLLNKKIKLSVTQGNCEKILDEISAKGGFSFTYSSKIPVNKQVKLSKNRLSVRQYLDEIFKDDQVKYFVKSNKILLVPTVSGFNKSLQKITGKVVEKGTDEPLPFANVYLYNMKTGTVTNTGGDFCLNLKTVHEKDTLCISSIGYQLIKVPINSLDSNFLIFKLTPEIHELKEARVKPADVLKIIEEAIDRIPENYNSKPCILTAFFRESTKKDNEYISLSEAIVNIYKESYNNLRNDLIKIEKGRKGTNVVSQEYLNFIVQGGLYNNFKLDIVKYRVNFLDKSSFANYNYKIDKISLYRGKPVYIIQFEQKKDDYFPFYSGTLYIDKESLAIVKAEFGINSKGIKYASDIYIIKNPTKFKVNPLFTNYQVNYIRNGDKWDLSSARSEIKIHVKNRNEKKKINKISSVFASISEFVITQKDTLNIKRFRSEEISKPTDVLVKQISETDENFWGNENIILPDEPLLETILKLNQLNKPKQTTVPVETKNN